MLWLNFKVVITVEIAHVKNRANYNNVLKLSCYTFLQVEKNQHYIG